MSAVLGVGLAGLPGPTVSGVTRDDRALLAAVRQLRAVCAPDRDGAHLRWLVSLRQLKAPSLQTLLYKLVQHEDAGMQLHAVLGLAEVGESGFVDPWLIRKIGTAEGQAAAVASVVDADLIDASRLQMILADAKIAPEARVLAAAALAADGQLLDPAHVQPLIESPTPTTMALAVAALAQGGDVKVLETIDRRLEPIESMRRAAYLSSIFTSLSTFELTASSSWIAAKKPAPTDAGYEPRIAALLSLDPERGDAAWVDALDLAESYSAKMRLALLLLRFGHGAAPSTWERLASDDPTIKWIADSGRAIAERDDRAGALLSLIELGHPLVDRATLKIAEPLDGDVAIAFYTGLLDRLFVDHDEAAKRRRASEHAIIATAALVSLAPERVRERLARCADDSPEQIVMLIGLLDSRDPIVRSLVEEIPCPGYGRADTLVTILLAKHRPELTPEQLQRLAFITAGGGQLSDALRMQATWLYLQHTDAIDLVLAAVFEPKQRTSTP